MTFISYVFSSFVYINVTIFNSTCKCYKLSMLSPLSVKSVNTTKVLQVSLLQSVNRYQGWTVEVDDQKA